MARVLSLTRTKLQELDIERDDNIDQDSRGMTGAVFRVMSPMSLSHCCDAFSGLREVTIATSEHEDLVGRRSIWLRFYLALRVSKNCALQVATPGSG